MKKFILHTNLRVSYLQITDILYGTYEREISKIYDFKRILPNYKK